MDATLQQRGRAEHTAARGAVAAAAPLAHGGGAAAGGLGLQFTAAARGGQGGMLLELAGAGAGASMTAAASAPWLGGGPEQQGVRYAHGRGGAGLLPAGRDGVGYAPLLVRGGGGNAMMQQQQQQQQQLQQQQSQLGGGSYVPGGWPSTGSAGVGSYVTMPASESLMMQLQQPQQPQQQQQLQYVQHQAADGLQYTPTVLQQAQLAPCQQQQQLQQQQHQQQQQQLQQQQQQQQQYMLVPQPPQYQPAQLQPQAPACATSPVTAVLQVPIMPAQLPLVTPHLASVQGMGVAVSAVAGHPTSPGAYCLQFSGPCEAVEAAGQLLCSLLGG